MWLTSAALSARFGAAPACAPPVAAVVAAATVSVSSNWRRLILPLLYSSSFSATKVFILSLPLSRLVDVFGDGIAELDVKVERIVETHGAVAAAEGDFFRGQLSLDAVLVPVGDREADVIDEARRRPRRIVAGIV